MAVADRARPAVRGVREERQRRLARFLGGGRVTASSRRLSSLLRRGRTGGSDQLRLRPARRLGAGPLQLRRPTIAERADRSPVRAADCRCRNCADRALRRHRDRRPAVGSRGDADRLPARGRGPRADLHRSALRRSDREPVLAGISSEVEEAALTLGATRLQTFFARHHAGNCAGPCRRASR